MHIISVILGMKQLSVCGSPPSSAEDSCDAGVTSPGCSCNKCRPLRRVLYSPSVALGILEFLLFGHDFFDKHLFKLPVLAERERGYRMTDVEVWRNERRGNSRRELEMD